VIIADGKYRQKLVQLLMKTIMYGWSYVRRKLGNEIATNARGWIEMKYGSKRGLPRFPLTGTVHLVALFTKEQARSCESPLDFRTRKTDDDGQRDLIY